MKRAVLLLVAGIVFSITAWATPAIPQAQASLEVGVRSTHELQSGQVHSYSLSLTNGQYFYLRVEQLGVDVAVDVFGPDQKLIEEFDSLTGDRGPEVVSVVAAASGVHRIEVRSLASPSVSGGYEMVLQEIRQADAEDRQRIKARRYSKDLAEKLRAAVEKGSEDEIVSRFHDAINEIAHPTSEPVMLLYRATEASQLPLKYATDGRFADAVSLAGKLFNTADTTLDAKNLIRAATLQNYINIELVVQNFDDARALLTKGLPFLDRTQSPHPLITITFLNLWGQMSLLDHRSKEAESAFRDALIELEQSFGLENQMSGPLYAFLAASLGQQGSFDEAETLFRKAIALNERFDVSGREAAIANAGLSRLFTMQTEYELAEPPSRRALSLLEQMHGGDHPDTALARADLAVTLARLNRDAEAHELFARALGVLESSFGPVSSKLLRPLHDWINALIAAGKYEQAAPYQEQVAKIEGVAQPVD